MTDGFLLLVVLVLVLDRLDTWNRNRSWPDDGQDVDTP